MLTFDIEYARWLEDQNKQINELRAAVNAHASDSDLRLILDGAMAHYDVMSYVIRSLNIMTYSNLWIFCSSPLC